MRLSLVSVLHLFSWLAFSLLGQAAKGQQRTVQGWVRDSLTAQPLPFAGVGIRGTSVGTLTDSAGYYRLIVPASATYLTVSHIGYQTRRVAVANGQVVLLQHAATELGEVIVKPGRNPADLLIEAAIRQKPINDPERWPSLAFRQYQKMTLSPLSDSVGHQAQPRKPTALGKLLRQHLTDSDLLISETVSAVTYHAPGHWHEHVEGFRASGTNSNLLASLLPDSQFFSLYPDFLQLKQKGVRQFVGPLSPNSTSRYAFTLRDTLVETPADTVYVIDYEPQRGTTFEGLRGTLHLHATDLALTYATATPADAALVLRFQTEQHYARLPHARRWIPAYLRTYWTWDAATELIGQPVGMLLQTWLTAPDLTHRPMPNHLLARTIDDHANQHDEAYWQAQRTRPLTARDQRTYDRFRQLPALKRVVIAGAFKAAEARLGGVLPLGPVDLPLVYVAGGNVYEGLRLGVGLQTSRRFSKYVRFESFAAYGLRDEAAKWGVGLLLRSDANEQLRLRATYKHDVWEPGNVEFFRDKLPLIPYESVRNFLVSRADNLRQFRAELAWRPHRYGQVFLTYLMEHRQPTYGYQFMALNSDAMMPYRQFGIRELSLGTRFAFGETFRQVGEGQAVQQQSRLTLMAQVAHGRTSQQGCTAYTKANLLLEARQPIRGFGETILNVSLGKVWGDLPLPWLVHARGSRSPLTPLWVANHFQTADPYEFVSDEYVQVFLTHSFGTLLARPKNAWFRPELSLLHSMAWGSLSHRDHHTGIPIKTLEAGLLETGLTLDNLLRVRLVKAAYVGAGGGYFMRWGANRLPTPAHNGVWRLVWNVSF
jgi:hypothetical protein